MKKRLSIFHFLIAVMLFSLVLPGVGNVEAGSPKVGSLTIHKYEQEPDGKNGKPGDGSAGQYVPNDANPLDGVTFKITQTHKYDQTTDTWTEVTNGATRTGVTVDGKVVFNFKKSELGRYTVEETDGPPHVNLNPTVYSVDIPMTNKDGSGPVNYHVHIYPKNEIIRGDVELKKKDGDTNNALQGVYFDLYNDNDELVAEGLQTDNNGRITVDNLAYGGYYFKETATKDGYLLGSQHVPFFIEKSNKTVKVNVKNYVEPEVEKEVDKSAVNRGEIVEYTIKVQLPGDIASYKHFNVTDTLHENLEFVEVVSQPAGFTFDASGQVLTWTATPSALSAGEVSFTFKAKVSDDAEPNVVINNKAFIDYENEHGFGGEKETDEVPVTPTAGSLKVIKKDGDTKEYLNGATFELRQGDVVVATGTTQNGGIIFFQDLDYGDYELVETKAPTGYRLLQNPINVTIDGNESNVTITVDNYKSGWELPKTGGIGTSIFTLLGLTLMGAALFAFLRRRNGDSA